ncbi:hypothetical protein HY734_01975 [Candidatus Uhrbacteria bacterium]|nr:hypothetical protein [Candidatus Uhrbacteria bacterium]
MEWDGTIEIPKVQSFDAPDRSGISEVGDLDGKNLEEDETDDSDILDEQDDSDILDSDDDASDPASKTSVTYGLYPPNHPPAEFFPPKE